MSDEGLRLLATLPAGALLFIAVRWLFALQKAVTTRFEHLILSLKADIVDLERRNDKLESDLSTERDARRADNHRCDEQITELRRRLAQITPPYGTPPTKGPS